MIVTPNKARNSKELLSEGSSEAIVETLRGMRRRLRRCERWLTKEHPYRNVVEVLKHKKLKDLTIDGEMLAEYIAASIPLHAADGWRYLSRAFDSISAGDWNTAVHLAYYAELRAGMSLLASEGVGVFDRRHVAIGPNCAPTVWGSNPQGTHTATWKLLESWANYPTRVTTLLTAIVVESRTIDAWLDAAGFSQIMVSSVAQEWLTAWSIDIENFERDREYRNHMSYRPSRISPDDSRQVDTSEDIADPILRIWDALEPTTDYGGAAIDRVLLGKALTKAHKEHLPSDVTWTDFLSQLEDAEFKGLQWQLADPRMNEHYVFRWAGDRSKIPPVQAVLARATLLLRIASGVCARRLSKAGVTKQEMKFWWSRFGEEGGLWSTDPSQDSFANLLWPEVVSDLEDVERELDEMDSTGRVYDLGPILGPKIALTQFTRAPLWLLGVD